MPFVRPTLTDLRSQVAQDIAAALPGADPLLRFSNLKITGDALAALTNLHYGYLDWIANQAVPFTATEEYLEGWAGLIGVVRKPAASASGSITFNGVSGTVIPAGATVVRSDSVQFTTTDAVAVSGAGTAVVPATANIDPSGQTGAFGNTAAGVQMTLGQVIAGIQSTGAVSTPFAGGADIEKDDELRSRMLFAFQNAPQGGAERDYILWALNVPGVTRAWAVRNGFGVGTVVVFVMLDSVRAAFNGFPQGSDGVAALEIRDAAATGDQLAVANSVFGSQPVTALVYVVAPSPHSINFAITGIPIGSRAAIAGAIADVFQTDGAPGGSIPIAHIWSAIAAISGVNDFVITSPTGDISNGPGELPIVGTVAFS